MTSPTCIRELDAEFGLNIAGQLFDAAEQRVAQMQEQGTADVCRAAAARPL